MRKRLVTLFICIIFLHSVLPLRAQRSYTDHSVLASGTWYKLAVPAAGVYKIDIPFLNTLGLNAAGTPSSALRLYGNGGRMLPESNAAQPPDDVIENAILVVDGGDGVFNGSDYLLFYAPGPDAWTRDSLNQTFIHQKNIYSDTAYYFIRTGGSGKRIATQTDPGLPDISLSEYQHRFFHELDTVNFLSSGKEWYGEEFTEAPGKTLTRSFSIAGEISAGKPFTLVSSCAARSIGTPSGFTVSYGAQEITRFDIGATGASLYDVFGREVRQAASFTPPATVSPLQYQFRSGSFNSQGWLNWFEIHTRKALQLSGQTQVSFRDWLTVGNGVAEFILSGAGNSWQVWDITEFTQPVSMITRLSGTELRIRNEASRLREYIAFSAFRLPVAVGKVDNQDLHADLPAANLIVTTPALLPAAEELARYHEQKDNLVSRVVTTSQVYNEFASGSPDPVAIRDFVKMYYDRAISRGADPPRFLTLFGDASFDYKDRIKGNTNLVPAYQNNLALDPLSTYTSDDFFGYLDDNEDINATGITNLLDIGIGRIPASSLEMAMNYVSKVKEYHDPMSFGYWRNQLSFIADDEDQNLHLEDAELISQNAAATNSLFDIRKIYLDAYPQVSASGGQRYPQVNEEIKNDVAAGTLIWNYNGHGSNRRLAEEVVLDEEETKTWNNRYRLPLLITATCDFAPYDNPLFYSIGERLLMRPQTGAIALMTTTRLVFAFSNRIMNDNYLKAALLPKPDGSYKTLGEAVREAKNFTYQNFSDFVNNRKFTLLGDPALRLGFPELEVRALRVNGVDSSLADTLSGGEKILVEGLITDQAGSVRSDFNGTAYVTVFDKLHNKTTLGNDPSSPVVSFPARDRIIYKGRSTVTNGQFKTEFKVPRDLDYRFGQGKMSFYAENGNREAAGSFDRFITGGDGVLSDDDREGPEIEAWLNDEKFVNGSIANTNPVLVLRFRDSSGINTLGTGIGHDITVTIDGDPDQYFVLNRFFEADPDNYKAGGLRFQLPGFEPGLHSLKIKAWDVVNNSSESSLDFQIVKDEDLVITRVLNYPNPFTTRTQFWFEHNRPGQELRVDIHVFTVSGKIIKRISQTINTEGNRSSEVEWDGRDDFGARIGRGVYIYKLRVTDPFLKSKTIVEKLVVF